MLHLQELTRSHDREAEHILSCQLTDPADPRYGAFILRGYSTDTRSGGFMLAHLAIAYLNKHGNLYLDERLKNAILLSFGYLKKHQRPNGCLDLAACNFASPPDTAFTMNAVVNAWALLEKETDEKAQWMKEPMLQLLVSCGEGIASGGFHTPNHRWAIAASLKTIARIADRDDFSARADEYLNEGLDINEDGEFAERSAGNYNQVNDDQMIRLYLVTGEKRFLEAAKANLLMMLHYIEPDDSVFTNNSTRQDYGRKIYLNSYYILFLLTGYLLKDPDLASYAEYCWQSASRHGQMPRGLEWLLLFEDMDGYGCEEPCDEQAFRHYNRHFPASKIARLRDGNMSLTVMEGKANFLYFQVGAMPVYMVIYSNLCDRRNFIASSIEPIEKGYRLKAHANSWYYKPFWPVTPPTSDWWAMDNPHTRERYQDVPLDTEVDVTMEEDGITVRVRALGINDLPLRIELGFPGHSRLRHESFLMEGKPGESMILAGGKLEVTGPGNETVVLDSGFAEHGASGRSDGAYPESQEHFTVYLTAYTPTDKTIRLSTVPFAKKDLLPWEEEKE